MFFAHHRGRVKHCLVCAEVSERAWHSIFSRLWFSLVHLVSVCTKGVTGMVRMVFGVSVDGTSGVNSVGLFIYF